MATGNEGHGLCAHPHPVLVSIEEETGRQFSWDRGMLSCTIGEASEEGMPCKQNALSSTTGKLVLKMTK